MREGSGVQGAHGRSGRGGILNVLLVVLAALALAYQAYVSVLLVRAGLDRLQLGVQLALTWLLPLAGAAVCHWFLRLHEAHEQPRPNRAAETLENAETFPTRPHDS